MNPKFSNFLVVDIFKKFSPFCKRKRYLSGRCKKKSPVPVRG